jgi:hypothetical protein
MPKLAPTTPSRTTARRPFRSLTALALAAAAIALTLAGARHAPGAGDVLPPDLRARVDTLLRTVTTRPASREELAERLDTLWLWGNAHALAGGPLPVDFSPDVARARTALLTGQSAATADLPNAPPGGAARRAGRRAAARERRAEAAGAAEPRPARGAAEAAEGSEAAMHAMISRYAHELALLDREPDALGRLALAPADPLRAAELATLVQTWTVGSKPMAAGGGLVLVVPAGVALQSDDPAGEGFLAVRASRPGSRLVAADPWGEWTSFIIRQTLQYRLEGETLEPGDTVTITYGDRSGGGPGMRLQQWSNDRVVLPVLLDLDGDGIELTPHWPSVTVLGEAAVHGVGAVAPSVVASGESFDLVVRSEDRFRNLASGGVPAYEVRLGGRVVHRLAADGEALAVVSGQSLRQPGVYRYEVRSRDGALTASSNPIVVERRPRVRVLWGDTHGHSGFAEGQGSPDGYYRFGRDVARLDFLSLSEHDLWMDDSEWRSLQEAVRAYDAPGRFTALLGYEWTVRNQLGGHHNVYFRDAEGRRRVPVQDAPVLDSLYAGLRERYDPEDVLVVPHAHQAGDWTRSDAGLERLAEITSSHGTFDFFGQKYLDNGFRVGFIGSSDNHAGHPGYSGVRGNQLGGLAAVLAPENTGAAVFDALRARATYATTGERIVLDASLDGATMGSELPARARRRIECRVAGTAPIDAIDVIKNGEVVFTRRYLEGSLAPRMQVQVRFASSSEVFNGHRNPRGNRPWRGSIEVEGARILAAREPWFAHPTTFEVTRPPGGERVDFEFSTRGRAAGLLLELDGASEATRIVVHLDAAREAPGSPGAPDRPPADLPAADLSFVLGDLVAGPREHELVVVRNVDRVSAQLVPEEGALDRSFEWSDGGPAAPGDSYFLRVHQVDGGMAWSSPWWVGKP